MFSFSKNISIESTDEMLMSQLCKGNKIAFELLYERYIKKLTWFANNIVNEIQVAEDIVQEVFIIIIKSPEKFDGGKKFSTWVYTVTSNLAKNHLRNEKIKSRNLNAYHLPQNLHLHHSLDSSFLQRNMDAIFNTLSEKEKAIFHLRFEQKFSIKEIAASLQIPEGSVKSGIFYLLKKYGNLLKQFSYEH